MECAICNNVKFYCKYSPNQHEEDCQHLYFPPISRADFIVPTVKTLCDRKTPTKRKENKKQNQTKKEGVDEFKRPKKWETCIQKRFQISQTFRYQLTHLRCVGGVLILCINADIVAAQS